MTFKNKYWKNIWFHVWLITKSLTRQVLWSKLFKLFIYSHASYGKFPSQALYFSYNFCMFLHNKENKSGLQLKLIILFYKIQLYIAV